MSLDDVADRVGKLSKSELGRAAQRAHVKATVACRHGNKEEMRQQLYFAAFCFERLAAEGLDAPLALLASISSIRRATP
jgi:hypothetical protein